METAGRIRTINRFCVLICAHNEAAHIGDVVRTALEQNPCKVVVVDDGSDDNTADLAKKAGAYVVSIPLNIGKGGALRRGFELVREQNCEAVIVVDGDGQHDPREIGRFLDAYERTRIPMLIGNRMADTAGMPLIRRWTNRTMAWVLNRLVKVYVPDPPCGYRFYRADILPFIMSEEDGFSFEFDLLVHAALRRIRIDSVRISTIYPKDRHSQVAPLSDALSLFRVVRSHFFEGRADRRLRAMR